MRAVPLPEFELLTIAKALFVPTEMVRLLLVEARTPPGLDTARLAEKSGDKNKTTDNRNKTAQKLTPRFQLSEDGYDALEQVLTVGTMRVLAQGGGWMKNPHLTDTGALKVGRIWERWPELNLSFTDVTPRLLWWLLESPLSAHPACPVRPPTSPGDQLIVYLAGSLLIRCEVFEPLKHPIFAENPFLALVNPYPTLVPDFRPLMTGVRSLLLEGLQLHLLQGVVVAERQMAAITDPARFEATATLRQRCLNTFLDHAQANNRRDLAHFLVDLVTRYNFPPAPKLDPKSPLMARSAAARVAPVLPRLALRLGGWQKDLESVHFFDDGYQEARGILKRWSRLTPARIEQARQAEAAMQDAFSSVL